MTPSSTSGSKEEATEEGEALLRKALRRRRHLVNGFVERYGKGKQRLSRLHRVAHRARRGTLQAHLPRRPVKGERLSTKVQRARETIQGERLSTKVQRARETVQGESLSTKVQRALETVQGERLSTKVQRALEIVQGESLSTKVQRARKTRTHPPQKGGGQAASDSGRHKLARDGLESYHRKTLHRTWTPKVKSAAREVPAARPACEVSARSSTLKAQGGRR
jgi:hypothetical protein